MFSKVPGREFTGSEEWDLKRNVILLHESPDGE
jgi:hypothetical protein